MPAPKQTTNGDHICLYGPVTEDPNANGTPPKKGGVVTGKK